MASSNAPPTAQTTSMEGIETGNFTSLKRPWPFGPKEPYEPAGYSFNPQPFSQPFTESFQAPWDVNAPGDQSYLTSINTFNNFSGVHQINQGSTFGGQALGDHVTEHTGSLRSILNQEYAEPQGSLERPKEICFGSV
jgi:hypothetical protein